MLPRSWASFSICSLVASECPWKDARETHNNRTD